jgi:hypothetical protein
MWWIIGYPESGSAVKASVALSFVSSLSLTMGSLNHFRTVPARRPTLDVAPHLEPDP